MAARQIVIHHRTSGTHGLRVLSENAGHHFDPIRANHAIGVETAQNVAGGVVQTIIARRNQPLLLILMQQTDGCFRVVFDELLHHGHRRIGGTIVDNDHFMGHHGLPSGIQQAIVDTLLFIPSGDDN